MKICSKCKEEKSVTEFYRNKAAKDGLQYSCKGCSNLASKQHYNANTEYYVEKARKRQDEQRAVIEQWIMEYLNNHPCVECGEEDPIVLTFDHIDPATKCYAIAVMIGDGHGLASIQEEVTKCQVLCSNDHARRTATQVGNWKIKYMSL